MKSFFRSLLSRSRIVAAAAALTLLGAVSVAVPSITGDGGISFAQGSDALAAFVERSPGERGETDTIKGRVEAITARLLGRRANGGEPEQRALGKMFDTPPEEALADMQTGSGAPGVFAPPEGEIAPLSAAGGLPPATPVGAFPGGLTAITPPTDPLPPGTPNVPLPPTTPVAQVPAIPEPSTWALMLFGLALCAAALRHRRRAVGGPQQCPAPLSY